MEERTWWRYQLDQTPPGDVVEELHVVVIVVVNLAVVTDWVGWQRSATRARKPGGQVARSKGQPPALHRATGSARGLHDIQAVRWRKAGLGDHGQDAAAQPALPKTDKAQHEQRRKEQ